MLNSSSVSLLLRSKSMPLNVAYQPADKQLVHKNARLTPLGRAETAGRIREEGPPVAVVAAGFGGSENTCPQCVKRFEQEGPRELLSRGQPHRRALIRGYRKGSA